MTKQVVNDLGLQPSRRLHTDGSRSTFHWMVTGTLLSLAITVPTANAADADGSTSTAKSSEVLEEIVVTGSLISDPNYVSPSPIVSKSIEEIKETGAITLEASLNQMPQFAPAGAAGNGGQGTGGHATINMHGLGANRNLVLLDGRRLPLADISGIVDINLIPDSILSGVETITGGASAVYGSDAMSGVVNFKTLTQFEGIKADIQYGNSTRNDLRTVSGSTAFGGGFADDKGHILLSLGYSYRQGLKGTQREFFNLVTPSSFIGQGTFVPAANNLPSQTAVNNLFAGYGVATPVGNTLNLGFNDNGTLFTQTGARNYLGPTSGGYAIIGGNVRMPVGPQFVIMNPLDRKSVFTKFDYEVAPAVTFYGQILYVDSNVYTSSGGSLTQIGALTTIPVTNPFIPTDLRTLLASRPNPNAAFTWNGRYVGLPYKAWDEQYTVSQYLGGVKGNLPFDNWTWDVFASYDTTNHLQSNYNAVLKSQVQNLLNAADGGNSLCAGGFNPFGLNHSSVISDACRRYMTTTAKSTEKLTQVNVQGLLQGKLFAMPAGDVNVALLADHRRNTYLSSPDSQLTLTNIEAVAASQPSEGAISVNEFAAQIDVPLLRDMAFADKLSVGAAFRHSKYSTSGGVNTYEGDIKWAPIKSLLVRGSYQRAVRAPNIGELFQATSGVQVAFGTPPAAIGDPCDIRSLARTGANGASVRALCLAQGIPSSVIDSYTFPTTATGGTLHGNPTLTPETADTYNIGFVWTPKDAAPLLSNFSASVDYYNISIKDVISVVPGLTALSKCYNLDGSNPGYAASNTFCALLTRDSNGLLQNIDTPYFNLGGLKANGVDIQLAWRAAFSDLGMGNANGNLFASTGIGYLHNYGVQILPNSAFQNYEGTNTIAQNSTTSASFPRWKAVTTVGADVGAATVGVRWRYQDAMKDVTSVTSPTNPGVGVDVYHLFDLYGSYNINENWQIRGGINNVADKLSVLVSSSQTSTDTAVFDPVGRSYYIGLHVAL